MASAVSYCNFSLQAFLYHFMVINEHKYEEFNDDLYDEILENLDASGNHRLIDKMPEDNVRKEAAVIYNRVWERM